MKVFFDNAEVVNGQLDKAVLKTLCMEYCIANKIIFDENKIKFIPMNEKELGLFIYEFYPSEKQQQDEKRVSSYTTKLKAQGVENLELKVVGMITSFYQGSNLEDILSSVEDAQKPYFEKLVKVGIRTEWMEICINEGQTAIAEDREPNYPKFPTIN